MNTPHTLGLEFWVHWLVYGFILDNVKKFEAFLALCKKNGVAGVELPWKPLMGLTPLQVATSLKRYKIKKMALCIFFGDIDPLDGHEGRRAALVHIENAMRYIANLRDLGIEVTCIDGPFAYQIGKKYGGGIHHRLHPFLKNVSRIASRYETLCCIESLRPEENDAIGDGTTTARVIEWVGSPWIRAHLDTFHMDKHGEEMIGTLARTGDGLGWFHVSGRDRHTPGSTGDKIDWKIVAAALTRNRADCDGEPITCVCFEAFGPAFRKGVPAIGAGFPKDLPPARAIATCKATLRRAGII